MTAVKNLLLSCGAYYLAILLQLLLLWPWALVSNRVSFTGDLQIMLLMPAVSAVPATLAAFATGVAIAYTADTRFPGRWALLPAGLFFERHIFGNRSWHIGPTMSDYIAIGVEAAFPALACVLGAVIAEGRRQRSNDLRSQKVD